MATFTRRETADGETRWLVRIRRKGHPMVARTFRAKLAAQEWARKIEAEVEVGRLLPRLEAERWTLEEAVERYLADHAVKLAPRSRRIREAQLGWWRERFRGPLSGLTPGALSAAVAELGRSRGPGTVNRYLAALSAVLDLAAREWQWMDSNPVRSIRRRVEPPGRLRYLSDEERERLLDACRESRERRLLPLVVLALATGARQGELMALRWEDVDLVKRTARVRQSKNRQRRTLALPGKAADVLRDLPRSITGHVFAGPSGRPAFPRRAWGDALVAAKLADFRFHDLRHTAASYLAMSGATLAELAAFLGHKTLAMVSRYAHLSSEHSTGVAERMVERYLT